MILSLPRAARITFDGSALAERSSVLGKLGVSADLGVQIVRRSMSRNKSLGHLVGMCGLLRGDNAGAVSRPSFKAGTT